MVAKLYYKSQDVLSAFTVGLLLYLKSTFVLPFLPKTVCVYYVYALFCKFSVFKSKVYYAAPVFCPFWKIKAERAQSFREKIANFFRNLSLAWIIRFFQNLFTLV
jgi:hypothetical protein